LDAFGEFEAWRELRGGHSGHLHGRGLGEDAEESLVVRGFVGADGGTGHGDKGRERALVHRGRTHVALLLTRWVPRICPLTLRLGGLLPSQLQQTAQL